MPIIIGAPPPAAPTLVAPARFAPDEQRRPEVVVEGRTTADPPPPVTGPASAAGIDAAHIAERVNALTTEDTLKYLPSLLVRQRHPGDTQATLATRTAGVGASARTLVYADGQLLSALIANNNTIGSPRWGLVSPQEIARIDVLYGPYSAAYPGNSIGAVVAITTRQPDRLEASVTAGSAIGRFSRYGERLTTPTKRFGATLGDRIGPLALFASVDRLIGDALPLTYVTAAPTTAPGRAATGGFATLNRTGGAVRVLGSGGAEHNEQTRAKLKAAVDLATGVRLAYTGALFANDTTGRAQSFVTDLATGLPAYGGTFAIDGRNYALATTALSAGFYRFRERHWSHALSLTGSGERLSWQLIGTDYRYADDTQRTPTVPLDQAPAGGAGTILKLNGTGWRTLDARATWRPAGHVLSIGAHWDRYRLNSRRFLTSDWLRGAPGALDLLSQGRTRTAALWAEDAWTVVPALTLTVGGRYEWWRADRGANFSRVPPVDVTQPVRRAATFSPKATLGYGTGPWRARLSAGQAWRFPTVAELYQVVTTPVAAVPDPRLRPERARSVELAIERRDAHGQLRLALFSESVRDALLSQSAALPGSTQVATYVQNVGRTRVRGVEAVVDRIDLLPRLDVQASATFADARVRANPAFPASVGKRLPQVPRWRGTVAMTWRPRDDLSLTAAGRVATRGYATIDNSDSVANTYQGFSGYTVLDLRARWQVGRYAIAVGVDNLGNDRYFLFHPFPERTIHADVSWRL